MSAQPNPNPNNSKPQAQRYVIFFNDIHLRLGTTLSSPQGPVITEVEGPLIDKINVPSPQASLVTKEPPFWQRLVELDTSKENQVVIDPLN